ncbi:MAG: hypothetical protein JSS72_11165 [Armatimonadetes bacterium]|nr:hypothetical protein [Armatimonadota bacterium]
MERPSRLINPETGEVELLLYPYHLDRLHGPYQGDKEADEAIKAGLSFPLLVGLKPTIVVFRAKMTPYEILAAAPNDSSFFEDNRRLHAYALTPVGWTYSPDLFFEDSKLNLLHLFIAGMASRQERLASAIRYLSGSLEQPDLLIKQGWFKNRPVRSGENPDAYIWNRPWGKVIADLDYRDNEPEIFVDWRSPD